MVLAVYVKLLLSNSMNYVTKEINFIGYDYYKYQLRLNNNDIFHFILSHYTHLDYTNVENSYRRIFFIVTYVYGTTESF